MQRELVNTEQAAELLNVKSYQRFRSICAKMKGFPEPVIKRGGSYQPNKYSKQAIIEYGKSHNVTLEMNRAFNEYRRQRLTVSRSTHTPEPQESLVIQFLRGEFDRPYQKYVRGKLLELARQRQPQTTRISLRYEDYAA